MTLSHMISTADSCDKKGLYHQAAKIDKALIKYAQDYDDDGGYEPYEDDLKEFGDRQAWEDSRADMEQDLDDHHNRGRRDWENSPDVEDEEDEPYFTIEAGEGATYKHPYWSVVLYYHDTYPESSVLGGQERRVWIESFEAHHPKDNTEESILEARKGNVENAQKYIATRLKEERPDIDPQTPVHVYEGSSYREPYLEHLPDDEDY